MVEWCSRLSRIAAAIIDANAFSQVGDQHQLVALMADKIEITKKQAASF
jgi:hypothetical protein